MDDFLSIARRFDQEARHEIKLYDLGVALLLEYFAWPGLLFTRYVPLRHRPLRTLSVVEMSDFLDKAPQPIASHLRGEPIEVETLTPQLFEALNLIGRALVQRQRNVVRINRMSRVIMLAVGILDAGILASVIRAPEIMIIGGWLGAMTLAMVICLRNGHWKSS